VALLLCHVQILCSLVPGVYNLLCELKYKNLPDQNLNLLINSLDMAFYVRKQLLLLARLSHRNSVCPSICHTGGSVKNGPS